MRQPAATVTAQPASAVVDNSAVAGRVEAGGSSADCNALRLQRLCRRLSLQLRPAARKSRQDGSVKERILALAVDKTGYPADMLDLDLDLEADLGVDTVKQAEIFAAIREMYNIPRDENRKLRDYPTLAHVIRFVYEKRPDLAGGIAAPRQDP